MEGGDGRGEKEERGRDEGEGKGRRCALESRLRAVSVLQLGATEREEQGEVVDDLDGAADDEDPPELADADEAAGDERARRRGERTADVDDAEKASARLLGDHRREERTLRAKEEASDQARARSPACCRRTLMLESIDEMHVRAT